MASQEDPSNGASQPANKVAVQMKKMRDANVKYKDLLKMAKERIQQQEEELKRLRAESENLKRQHEKEEKDAATMMGMDDTDAVGDSAEHSCNIVRVCQRIKMELDAHELNSKGGNEEIWALVEWEIFDSDHADTMMYPKRTKKWKKFDSESELSDFIRRDTGEPLTLPPYSLTPQQSAKIEEIASNSVSHITEEFRRFRVKSEMARKQADAQIRDLQSNNVESAKRRIEGQDVEKELEQARTEHSRLERMKAEMARQEVQWKEAYDVLFAENESLKSSGSEALLASQWRQRYEACLREKEECENKLKMELAKGASVDAGKYEVKYRDLKESFRLYRKKAKEIFEAQQNGENGAGLMKFSEKSSEESKLSYLKNLMVNYLTSDLAVREHMEGAIGTVLQFTPDDIAKIEKKKIEGDYWGLF